MPAAAPLAQRQSAARQANPEQQAAITSPARKILVAAGPGTGKTFTLVQRISHLLTDTGNGPETFVAITFTNRAADEVRERLTRIAGPPVEKLFVGTLHRFCLDWLRQAQPDLTVIGDEERQLLIKRLFPAADNRHRSAINREIETYLATPAAERPELADDHETARYLAELAGLAALDLDNVIPAMLARLATDRAFREEVRDRVQFLFVDEFQDLNQDQYQLMLKLAESARIFAIGDPDQAIYGFRGADLNCFFDFSGRNGVETMNLQRNYRSATVILKAAGEVIRHNRLRSEVVLQPRQQQEGTITYYPAPTPQAEAEYIVQRIEELLGGVSHFSINSGRSGQGEVNFPLPTSPSSTASRNRPGPLPKPLPAGASLFS